MLENVRNENFIIGNKGVGKSTLILEEIYELLLEGKHIIYITNNENSETINRALDCKHYYKRTGNVLYYKNLDAVQISSKDFIDSVTNFNAYRENLVVIQSLKGINRASISQLSTVFNAYIFVNTPLAFEDFQRYNEWMVELQLTNRLTIYWILSDSEDYFTKEYRKAIREFIYVLQSSNKYSPVLIVDYYKDLEWVSSQSYRLINKSVITKIT